MDSTRGLGLLPLVAIAVVIGLVVRDPVGAAGAARAVLDVLAAAGDRIIGALLIFAHAAGSG